MMASTSTSTHRHRSGWPDLPPELLECVMRLLTPLDRVAVRLVCSSWRACARASFPADLPFEPPRLLFRRPGPGGAGAGALAFFSLHRRKVLPFALPARVSAARCCGHAGAWLAMALDDDRRAVSLYNFLSGESLPLPPPPVFPVAKIVLSAPPTSPGWVAAALGRSGTIVLLHPDSAVWITMDEGAEHGGFVDMAFWRGRLCALGHDGVVLSYRWARLGARVAAVSELRAAQRPAGERWRLYLVECEGELVVVRKQYRVWRDAAEVEVEATRFVAEERRWEAAEELPGGRALFVGSVASASATSTAGARENCVYFARGEVDMMVPHAIGVYSLDDEETTAVAIDGGHSVGVEPVWITASVLT